MQRYICGDSEAKSCVKLLNLTCAVSGTKWEMLNATNHPARHEDMEMPFILKAVLYIVLSIVAFLSVIGNTLEILAFLRSKNLRTSTNYYITSMAFSDVILVLSVWMLYSMSRLSVLLVPFLFSIGVEPRTHLSGQICRHSVPYENIDDDRKNQSNFYLAYMDLPYGILYSRFV